jgi:hypothetical protein
MVIVGMNPISFCACLWWKLKMSIFFSIDGCSIVPFHHLQSTLHIMATLVLLAPTSNKWIIQELQEVCPFPSYTHTKRLQMC